MNIVRDILLFYFKTWARLAVALHRPKIIGITGSVGKSSARDAISAAISSTYHTYTIDKGNSETGVPLGLLGLHVNSLGFQSGLQGAIDWIFLFLKAPFCIFFLRSYSHVVIEFGIDEPDPPKNMGYLMSIVQPHIAVMLNVSAVHSAQFEKLFDHPATNEELIHAIFMEKAKILTANHHLQTAILNHDDTEIHSLVTKFPSITFGQSDQATIRYMAYDVDLKGSKFEYQIKGKTHSLHISGCILPPAFGSTFGAAIGVAQSLNISADKAIQAIATNFTVPPGRSSVFTGINRTTLIDSSYNSSPEAMLTMIDMAKKLAKKDKRSLVVVMGDMRELGHLTGQKHQQVAEALTYNADAVICVGPMTQEFIIPYLKEHMQNVAPASIQWFKDAKEAGTYLAKLNNPYAIILFKGSQNTIFLEETVKMLLANKDDVNKLCRQEEYWKKVKYAYGL